MSQLKFWNKQNNKAQDKDKDKDDSNAISHNNNGNLTDSKNGKKNWLHAPDALVNGHVVYLVKFFGNLHVDQPKGIDVVKDAIRKLQFAQQMKKAETGTQEKFKKVEITISVDGVAIQEPRTQKILHQFPLHNISYCADEKGVKKFLSFIAKTVKPPQENNEIYQNNYSGSGGSLSNGSSNAVEETHECFVFISNKLASDITLTIGQAFDLAYRKYINTAEKSDLAKAQQQINNLEHTITIYKQRLRDLAAKIPKAELEQMLFKMSINDICDVPANELNTGLTNGSKMPEDKLLIDTKSTTSYLPIVPPRNTLTSQIINSNNSSGGGSSSSKSNGKKMDELLLNSDSDSDFDPRADEIVLDNSSSNGSGKNVSNDLFGFEPAKSYGQQLFFTNNNDHKILNNNSNNLSFSNETPPLLAPPPKLGAPRRSTSVPATQMNGNTDLFGSDPFEINNGPVIFNKHKLNIDDFSLESLDPLRK